eukprot:1102107-Rhodomonas_salina.1
MLGHLAARRLAGESKRPSASSICTIAYDCAAVSSDSEIATPADVYPCFFVQEIGVSSKFDECAVSQT